MLLRRSCWIAFQLVCAEVVLAAPIRNHLGRRSVVPHDSILPLSSKVQPGIRGDLIRRFNPRLHIASGCQNYPAVDDVGNTSGGLQDSGSSTGGCRDDGRGQTYARMGQPDAHGRVGIMYGWYFPKDQLEDAISAGAHRHDWENYIVWIEDPAKFTDPLLPKVLGGGVSGHGEYTVVAGALAGGNSATIEYYAFFPTNHELQFTGSVGPTHNVLDWDAMSEPMRTALQLTDFGQGLVPFKNGLFEANLEKAALPAPP